MNKMKKKVLMMTMAAVTLSAVAQQPVDYVNPIIGTNGMGHTFPGACTPFGWVQLSPDTDTIPHNVNGAYQKNAYEYCAGYQYRDKTIVGFSHTHLSGTGHSDLGDILLMPAVGDVKLNPGRADHPEEGYRSRFDHATEKATPGYYEVMLDDYGIKAQLTATQRTGVHKYTFPKGKDGHLILDLVHGIYNYDGKVLWANLRVENDTLLTGYRITNGWARTNYTYFAISLSQPIKDYGYKDKEKVLYNGFWRRFKLEKNFPEITGRKIVAYFNFETAKDPELVVKVALSAISTFGIRLLIATLKPFLRPVMKISKGLLLFLTCVAVALGIFEILLIESLEAEADKHAADKLEAEHHNQRNPNRNQEGHEKGRSNREVVVNQTSTCILPAGNNDQVLFSDLSGVDQTFCQSSTCVGTLKVSNEGQTGNAGGAEDRTKQRSH